MGRDEFLRQTTRLRETAKISDDIQIWVPEKITGPGGIIRGLVRTVDRCWKETAKWIGGIRWVDQSRFVPELEHWLCRRMKLPFGAPQRCER